MEEATILSYFLGLLDQIKLYHWATMSYAKHKALDSLHETLSEKADTFVEAYLGRYKKQPLKKMTLKMTAESAGAPEKFVEAERENIAAMSEKTFAKAPELQNILEDMMTAMNQTLYLLKLE